MPDLSLVDKALAAQSQAIMDALPPLPLPELADSAFAGSPNLRGLTLPSSGSGGMASPRTQGKGTPTESFLQPTGPQGNGTPSGTLSQPASPSKAQGQASGLDRASLAAPTSPSRLHSQTPVTGPNQAGSLPKLQSQASTALPPQLEGDGAARKVGDRCKVDSMLHSSLVHGSFVHGSLMHGMRMADAQGWHV